MRELTEKQADFLSLATDILDKRELRPEDGYWLTEDYGEDYCLDCIKASKTDFDWDTDWLEYFEGGGNCWPESDGSKVCETCGKLLGYTLTDYGVIEELGHFSDPETSPFDWGSPDECFQLARVAHGIYENPDQERMLINVLLKGKNFPKELKRIHAPKIAVLKFAPVTVNDW